MPEGNPNQPSPPTSPTPPQNPAPAQPAPAQPQTPAAPTGTDAGAAAGAEVAQTGQISGTPQQQSPEALKAASEALKKANDKAMQSAIPFAIGLDALPADAMRQTAQMQGGAAGAAVDGGVFPPSDGICAAISVPWGNDANVDWFNATNPGLKQMFMAMTVFQSFPVIKRDGMVITRVTDLTSTKDGAGTNKGSTSFNGFQNKGGYADTMDQKILQERYNLGVRNFQIGGGCALKYIDDWLKKYYPSLVWQYSHVDKNTSWGRVWAGGWTGRLLGAGCWYAEVVFPVSPTEGKVLKTRIISVGPEPAKDPEVPVLDIMGGFCVINSHRDIFNITANGTRVDGTNLAFLFQNCPYDYKKGEIIGYGPETLYQKYYPSGGGLFGPGGKCVFDETAAYSQYSGYTVGGAKSPGGATHKRTKGFSLVKVRFFIDPSMKEKAEKIIKKPLPPELMKVNYTGGTSVGAIVSTVAGAVANSNSNTSSPSNSQTPSSTTKPTTPASGNTGTTNS